MAKGMQWEKRNRYDRVRNAPQPLFACKVCGEEVPYRALAFPTIDRTCKRCAQKARTRR